jgi:DnaJ-class molecular chaperone
MQSWKEYYRLLHVPENANKNDIRKAYLRLSLKHHPDKNNGDSSEFIKITNAYNTLLQTNNSNNDSSPIDMNIILKYCYFLYNFINEKYNEKIIINLDVTLEEVYHHAVKKLKIRVKRNENLEYSHIELYISLLMVKQKYVFEEMGDDFPFVIKGKKRSDIHVNINILNDDNIRISDIVDKTDLYMDQYINLYQCFFEETVSCDIFGQRIEVPLQSLNKNIIHFLKGLYFFLGDVA